MDFTSQNGQKATQIKEQKSKKSKKLGGLKAISVVLLGAVSVLILALVVLSAFGGPVHQSKHVKKDGLQAVFLNNGQVYFGNITSLGNDYMRLVNIYYLRQSESPQPAQQTTTNSNLSLIKLGCEVHGPLDEMIINYDQVNFWENLKSDGQVAKVVEQFVQQNPEGQKCPATGEQQ